MTYSLIARCPASGAFGAVVTSSSVATAARCIRTDPMGAVATQNFSDPALGPLGIRLLREGLGAWMQGRTAPAGMPSYVDFLAGVTTALDHVRDKHHGAKVLVVSSGGPISTAVGHVLGTSPETTVELNLRIRNTAVTEFAFTPKRHMLVTYNTLPHLDAPEYEDWVTYA